ncbi:mitochondrial outer membrane translocase complex, subunit Tom22 [Obelidium mucronatum]|nr:mitochondrial outer membrane translocase complex, subunit Tom22 [Obelidium mucronatum]
MAPKQEIIDLRGDEDRDEDFETEEEDDDFEDDEFESETLLERIAALADIIPPTKRHAIAKAVSNTLSTGFYTAQFAGKGLWVVATSALLVLMPVALEMERESFAIQQENSQRVQATQAAQIQNEVAQTA